MKIKLKFALGLLEWFATFAVMADPQISSWFTAKSGQFAQIYVNDAAKQSGQASTIWNNGWQEQAVPAYCGVQEISSSANWVYVRTTDLASYIMGPWYINAAHTIPFPNLPVDQNIIFCIPRHPVVAESRGFQRLGEIGCFVDGVRMFDANDAFSYSHANGQDANPRAGIGHGDGIWNRDAWVNERQTFDAGYAHQQRTGVYHYHANPVALRYLLGDHVDYNPATKSYAESATPVVKHSPIIGWMKDGFPLYGPYGYSDPKNPKSGARRMISGFVLRTNLLTTGRTTLAAWAGRAYDGPTALASSEFGPQVSSRFPLGHYIEDYEYLGDQGQTQGKTFDLDEFNGRYCVTPEFPNGTYAYFSTIGADGMPVYPYNMGRQYYGKPAGGIARSIREPVTTQFVGGTKAALKPRAAARDTLIWDSSAHAYVNAKP